MDAYDIYGVNFDLFFTKQTLEKCLSLQFEKRDSSYFGEYFIAGDRGGEHFEIKNNLDLTDGEPLKQEFSNYPVLVFVNCTKRFDEIYQLLQGGKMERLSHNLY